MNEAALVTQLLFAAACGLLVGIPAELRHRPGGLRTHALAAMGATLFTQSALAFTTHPEGSVRVIQGVASGVGFIGAATILRREGSVHGVNTAASIWIVAAIGCFAATGGWRVAVVSALVATLLNAAGMILEDYLERREGRAKVAPPDPAQ